MAGNLSKAEGFSIGVSPDSDTRPEDEHMRSMLIDWSQHVETWSRIKNIADRAMGSFVAHKVRSTAKNSEFSEANLLLVERWNRKRQSWLRSDPCALDSDSPELGITA